MLLMSFTLRINYEDFDLLLVIVNINKPYKNSSNLLRCKYFASINKFMNNNHNIINNNNYFLSTVLDKLYTSSVMIK